jgi:hypothetical protein
MAATTSSAGQSSQLVVCTPVESKKPQRGLLKLTISSKTFCPPLHNQSLKSHTTLGALVCFILQMYVQHHYFTCMRSARSMSIGSFALLADQHCQVHLCNLRSISLVEQLPVCNCHLQLSNLYLVVHLWLHLLWLWRCNCNFLF